MIADSCFLRRRTSRKKDDQTANWIIKNSPMADTNPPLLLAHSANPPTMNTISHTKTAVKINIPAASSRRFLVIV
jgi:hypothetical protein